MGTRRKDVPVLVLPADDFLVRYRNWQGDTEPRVSFFVKCRSSIVYSLIMLCKLQHGKKYGTWYLQLTKARQAIECPWLDWCNHIVVQIPTKYKIPPLPPPHGPRVFIESVFIVISFNTIFDLLNYILRHEGTTSGMYEKEQLIHPKKKSYNSQGCQ
jgi:hypothetical protein